MAYKKSVIIVDNERERDDIHSRLSSALRSTNDHHLVDLKVVSNYDELTSLIKQNPDVIVMGYSVDFIPDYTQILNGVDRNHLIFTYKPLDEPVARKLADDIKARYVI